MPCKYSPIQLNPEGWRGRSCPEQTERIKQHFEGCKFGVAGADSQKRERNKQREKDKVVLIENQSQKFIQHQTQRLVALEVVLVRHSERHDAVEGECDQPEGTFKYTQLNQVRAIEEKV